MNRLRLIVSIIFTLFVNASFGQSGPFTIVILGSSTAEGYGASPGMNWAAVYTNYLKKINPRNQVINLAKAGYSTIQVMPDSVDVPGYAKDSWDPKRNITHALSYHPDAIIINLPGNDLVYKVPLTQQQKNFEVIIGEAKKKNIPVWVTTTQPRRNFTAAQITYQLAMRDWIMLTYGDMAIDIWPDLSENTGVLRAALAFKDGVHLNDNGHAVLSKIIIDKDIPGYLVGLWLKLVNFNVESSDDGVELEWKTILEKNIKSFLIERSSDSITWHKIGAVTGGDLSTTLRSYSFLDTNDSVGALVYYRLYSGPVNNKDLYSKVAAVRGKMSEVVIYPNPVTDRFKLAGIQDGLHLLEVFDLQGRLVFSKTDLTRHQYISAQGLVPGIYFLKIDHKKCGNLKMVKL